MINDRGHKKWTSLMLPEHKELLRDWANQQNDIKKPVIESDQIEEMNRNISEAIKHDIRVSVTFYKNERIRQVVGYIIKCDNVKGIIRISEDSGITDIPFHSLIDLSH